MEQRTTLERQKLFMMTPASLKAGGAPGEQRTCPRGATPGAVGVGLNQLHTPEKDRLFRDRPAAALGWAPCSHRTALGTYSSRYHQPAGSYSAGLMAFMALRRPLRPLAPETGRAVRDRPAPGSEACSHCCAGDPRTLLDAVNPLVQAGGFSFRRTLGRPPGPQRELLASSFGRLAEPAGRIDSHEAVLGIQDSSRCRKPAGASRRVCVYRGCRTACPPACAPT
jgi:hypothetical protein